MSWQFHEGFAKPLPCGFGFRHRRAAILIRLYANLRKLAEIVVAS
ncbi:hypothetical protein [Sinorhizobium meliloti]|nr:hypothetical protein [Sinorhizobium meliloti]